MLLVDANLLITAQHAGTAGNLVPDAHLAALAIEHGLRLCTLDRGFPRFKGLNQTNPLAERH